MKKSMLACAVVMAMSFAPVLAQPPDPTRRPAPPQPGQPPPPGQPGQPPQGTAPSRTEQKPAADQQFVMNVAKDGIAEVELGKLASQKASNEQVKQFGQRMADEHGKANDELKKLASEKHITIPNELDSKHKGTVDKLSKLTGDAFDKAFTQEMMNGHKKAVSTFKNESKSGKDPEIKAWAEKTLPTLEDHFKQIQDLNRSVVGTSGVKQTEKPKGQN
jgi:putative membrane protein